MTSELPGEDWGLGLCLGQSSVARFPTTDYGRVLSVGVAKPRSDQCLLLVI